MRILLSSLILLITVSIGGITDKHSNTDASPKASRESIVVDDTKVFNQIRAGQRVKFREHQAAIALWNKKVEENRIAAQKAAARQRSETRAAVTNPTTPTVVDKVDVRRVSDAKWDAIARCETLWDSRNPEKGVSPFWGNPGPTYVGGLGIYIKAWRAASGGYGEWSGYPNLGYSDNFSEITREQQIIVAERIFAVFGLSGWGCKNAT